MALRLRSVTFDAREPARVAAFWAAALGRDVLDESGGPLLPGTETQVGLRFSPTTAEKVAPNRIHLHLTSDDPADQQGTVDRLLGLGARHLDVGQRPEEGHIVLADPEGNELCVIEPGNAFLAGCGFLGEIACEGTREVGLFWSEVLRWPLVWDRDSETAVQAPTGGTKVAWGGPPLTPQPWNHRQRFDLVVADGALAVEVERLIALGAHRVDDADGTGGAVGAVELTDTDGNRFSIAPG
ncbi:VOC family protein [Occultella glacieicola]|uniref:VOC family protein n=1 Tax=Occultella glacieicola TaxID=2518684 RepID=A0ABY2DWT0_9MICO|nr:VOC family protein [Occultella glacieicola]TDE88313.1 VOC family protein [Occultella glacieicola]